MAAKFSMVNTSGLFDQGAHLEASDRMQGAMEELKIKNERAEAAKQQQRAQQEKQEKLLVQRALRSQEAAIAAARQKDATYVRAKRDGADNQQQSEDEDDSDDDDALLDELEHDPELERCVHKRVIVSVERLTDEWAIFIWTFVWKKAPCGAHAAAQASV